MKLVVGYPDRSAELAMLESAQRDRDLTRRVLDRRRACRFSAPPTCWRFAG